MTANAQTTHYPQRIWNAACAEAGDNGRFDAAFGRSPSEESMAREAVMIADRMMTEERLSRLHAAVVGAPPVPRTASGTIIPPGIWDDCCDSALQSGATGAQVAAAAMTLAEGTLAALEGAPLVSGDVVFQLSSEALLRATASGLGLSRRTIDSLARLWNEAAQHRNHAPIVGVDVKVDGPTYGFYCMGKGHLADLVDARRETAFFTDATGDLRALILGAPAPQAAPASPAPAPR